MNYGPQTLLYYLTELARRSGFEGSDVFGEIRDLCEDFDDRFSYLQRQINELKQLTAPVPARALTPDETDDGHDTMSA